MAKNDSFILSFTKPIFDLSLNHPFLSSWPTCATTTFLEKKNCETRAAVTVVNTNFTKRLAWVVWPRDAANSSHTQLFTLHTRCFDHFYPISKQGACYRHQMYLCYKPSMDVSHSSFVPLRDNLIKFLFKRILLSVVSGGSGMLSTEQRANEIDQWKKKKGNASKVADSRLTLSLPYVDFLQNCGYVLGQK